MYFIKPKFWDKKNNSFLSILLYPLSFFYYLLAVGRFAYHCFKPETQTPNPKSGAAACVCKLSARCSALRGTTASKAAGVTGVAKVLLMCC